MKRLNILIVLLLGAVCSMHASKLIVTTTTITSALNPSVYGQAVTFTATVNSSAGQPPDGETVTFLQGSKTLGTGTLSGGSASFTTSALPVGSLVAIKATYAGDGYFGASTSKALDQVVGKASTTTTLTSSLNPSNYQQPITLSASVAPEFAGTVTGNVSFYNGSKKLGAAALSSGIANYTTSALPAGLSAITAVFNGSSYFTTSTSSVLTQTAIVGSTIDSTMTWNNVTRYYEAYVPAVLPPNPPLVLMLHGTRTTSGLQPEAVISIDWGWSSVANQYGFIVVKPASTYDPKTKQWNWNSYCMDATPTCAPYGLNGGAFAYAENCGSDDGECPDDSGFLRSLIQNLTVQYNVDPNRVYVTGFSSGAQMTERVGVEISDLVAAIAPASGQLVNEQGVVAPPLPLPGSAVAPISVQEWHGTLDTELAPCNYGTTVYSAVTFTLDTVDDTFNYWESQNSCASLQTQQTLCANNAPNNANDSPTPGMSGDTGNIATSCASPSGQNVEVQFIWEPGVEHNYEQQYNPQRWAFFAAHPKQ